MIGPWGEDMSDEERITAFQECLRTIDSLHLELGAERHNHRKDNEHFVAEIERLKSTLIGCREATDLDEVAVIVRVALGEKT
jgi:hypothetical protein